MFGMNIRIDLKYTDPMGNSKKTNKIKNKCRWDYRQESPIARILPMPMRNRSQISNEKLLPSLPIKYDQVCSGEKWSIFRFNVDYGEEWPIARVLPPAI